MSYGFWDQYDRPEWKRKAAAVKQLADWKCERCGKNGPRLAAHHRYYKSSRLNVPIWEYEDYELCALCKPCHDQFHKTLDQTKKFLGFLGPDSFDAVSRLIMFLTFWECPQARAIQVRRPMPPLDVWRFIFFMARDYYKSCLESEIEFINFRQKLALEHLEELEQELEAETIEDAWQDGNLFLLDAPEDEERWPGSYPD